jgi:hypothetical protein
METAIRRALSERGVPPDHSTGDGRDFRTDVAAWLQLVSARQ